MDIDSKGLDFVDKRILMAMIEKFGGGPVGLDTLSATTNEEVWLSYNSTILMDPPKIISAQEPRKYNYIDITKDDNYFTILLTKENYNDTLLYFELSYSSINVNSLNIITEKYRRHCDNKKR